MLKNNLDKTWFYQLIELSVGPLEIFCHKYFYVFGMVYFRPKQSIWSDLNIETAKLSYYDMR